MGLGIDLTAETGTRIIIEEKEPEDEQGYYVSSVHIKKYSAILLDTLHIKN